MQKRSRSFRNYSEVESFLLEQLPMFSRVGAAALKPSLANIENLCSAIGNPQNQYKIIHVAGTNGKGTVSHLVAGMLQSQGYTVGLHTSPHYKDLRERMKINGSLSSKRFVIDFMNENITLIEEIKPSFFEITVAMSFAHFAAKKVDFAVIEVGLGGRLDSTNIVQPILSIITNISLDHTDLLGNTIEAIAAEKAGIIKPGVPVLIGEQQTETDPVFNKIAAVNSSKMFYASDLVQMEVIENSLYGMQFRSKGVFENELFQIDISGPFQKHNLTTAFAAISLLQSHQILFDVAQLKAFLASFSKKVKYIGRWQIIGKNPLVLVDSAHNEGGMNYVLDQLALLGSGQLHFVIGFVSDKDRSKILPFLPKNAHYYFTKASIPRALDPFILKEEAFSYDLKGEVFMTVN
ncbi:MAG TPA: Mur ligase family protein, partial [Saprospiraceae bacterium]|nr:Mur ligase family protein [Saprospiraceae bacterium]